MTTRPPGRRRRGAASKSFSGLPRCSMTSPTMTRSKRLAGVLGGDIAEAHVIAGGLELADVGVENINAEAVGGGLG